MQYSYADNSGTKSLTLLFFEVDEDPVTIDPSHPEWATLVDNAGDLSEEDVMDLLVVQRPAAQWLGMVSDTVEVTLYGVKYEGRTIDGAVADAIMSVAGSTSKSVEETGDHIKALARFMVKADANPSIENSDDLYKWIVAEKLTIAPDGDVIGYKSCRTGVPSEGFVVKGEEYTFPEGMTLYHSSVAGGGIVDGIKFDGYVPNYVGARVEMERDLVDPDGYRYCSTGLHVGTHNYSSRHYNMGNLMLVKFNPRDVVAVPSDYSFQKLRTCAYTVIKDNVVNLLEEQLYVDDVFAPRVEDGVDFSTETVSHIIDRLRSAVNTR